jgi:hypothetical protein
VHSAAGSAKQASLWRLGAPDDDGGGSDEGVGELELCAVSETVVLLGGAMLSIHRRLSALSVSNYRVGQGLGDVYGSGGRDGSTLEAVIWGPGGDGGGAGSSQRLASLDNTGVRVWALADGCREVSHCAHGGDGGGDGGGLGGGLGSACWDPHGEVIVPHLIVPHPRASPLARLFPRLFPEGRACSQPFSLSA